MSRKSNTVPYTNDAREGRTRPGLIEIIEREDPRHWTRRGELDVKPNRADRRAWARRFRRPSPVHRSAAGRRVFRPKCVHGVALPLPWSAPEPYCTLCAAATTARVAAEKAAAEEAAAKPARRRRTPKTVEA